MKKLLAFLLALVLCVAMACPAFAADEAVTEGTDSEFTQSTEVPPPVVPGDPDLSVPETGDRSQENTLLLAGIMGLSFVGIVVVSVLLWKSREGCET